MSAAPHGTVTVLLRAIRQGQAQAASDLLPLIYDELRRLADCWMAKTPPGQTLQATALVHEAYLRLVGGEDPGWENRGHFFFAAARAMRQILVERARHKLAARRGGGRKRLALDQLALTFDAAPEEILALEEALARLEQEDPWKHRIVLLRFYAGLTNEEVARALDCSGPTIEREWRYIRLWLYRQLSADT